MVSESRSPYRSMNRPAIGAVPMKIIAQAPSTKPMAPRLMPSSPLTSGSIGAIDVNTTPKAK